MANIPQDQDLYQPETANRKSQRAILIMTADATEDLEFFYPYYRFIEAGFKVDIATSAGSSLKGKHGLGIKKTMKIADVAAEDYELLYIPGGQAPSALKKDENAIALTKHFVELGKPVSAVCHGPQMLAAANVIEGRKITAWPEVEDEIAQAGAIYVNCETLVDGPFITARWPGDLPMHMKETIAFLNKAKKSSITTHAAA